MAAVREISVSCESLHSERRVFDLIQQVQPPTCDTTPTEDSFFDQISVEMKAQGMDETWYSRPRTYFLLSKINNIGMMKSFILQGCDDTSIPYPSQNALPQSDLKPWNPFQVQDFMSWQRVCESEQLQLEKGVHCRLDNGDMLFREHGHKLGEGSQMNTTVDRVVSKFTGEVYARKRIRRKFPKDAQRAFQREIRALTKITEHNHLIRVCGTYTDKRYFALLLQPVADCTLKEYLLSPESKTAQAKASLWAYFGCMANVMTVLHDQEKILHKDIKAENFLLYQNRLILTDFGTAFDFSQTDQSMTWANREDARTLRYSSPEVVLEGRFHRASDVWSLGVVYLEILTVLCKKTLKEFESYMKRTHRLSSHVHYNQPAALDWLQELQLCCPHEADNAPFKVVPQMLEMTAENRPLASRLYSDLFSSQGGKFCGPCCREENSDPESDSDLLPSDEDEQSKLPRYQPYVQPIVDESDTRIPGSFPLDIPTYKTHDPTFNKTSPASISRYEAMHISNVPHSIPHDRTRADREEVILTTERSENIIVPEQAGLSRAEGPSHDFSYDESGKERNTSPRPKARIVQNVAKFANSFFLGHSGSRPKSPRDSRDSRERRPSRSPVAMRRRTRVSSRKDTDTTSSTLTVQDQRLRHFLTSLPTGEDYDLIEEDHDTGPPSPDVKRRLRLIHRIPARTKSQENLRSTTEPPEYRHEQSSDLIPSVLIRFPSDGNLRERYLVQEESRSKIEAELKGFRHSFVLPSPRQEELYPPPIFEVEPDPIEDHNRKDASPEIVVDRHGTDPQAPGGLSVQSVEPEPAAVPGSFPGDLTVPYAEETPLPVIAEVRASEPADILAIGQAVTTTNNTTPNLASHSPALSQTTVPHDENPPEYEASSATRLSLLRQVASMSERRRPKSSDSSSGITPLSIFLDAVPLAKKSNDKWESISVYMKRILDDKASVAPTSVMSVNTQKLLSAPAMKWNDEAYGYLPHFVAKGKVAAVRRLLSCGCNPGKLEKPRWMPLLAAVKGRTDKHTKCLIALIEHGANTQARDSTGKTYLHHAISQEPWSGYSTTIYVLLMNKVNPNVVDNRGNTPLLSLLTGKDRDAVSPLRQEEREALMVLLAPNFGTDIHKSVRGMNENVLHLAIMRHDPYVLDALLEKMDRSTKRRLVQEVDCDGYTPLILVLTMCSFSTSETAQTATRMLELLLQNGASPNDKDPETGDTPLHIVLAKHRKIEVFKLLTRHHADPTIKNAKNILATMLLHSLVGSERPNSFLSLAKKRVSGLEKWKVPTLIIEEMD